MYNEGQLQARLQRCLRGKDSLLHDLSAIGQVQGHFDQTMTTLLVDLESSSMCCYLALVQRRLDQ